MAFVLDVSVAATWFLRDERDEHAAKILTRVASTPMTSMRRSTRFATCRS
jgi:hypothetical protein